MIARIRTEEELGAVGAAGISSLYPEQLKISIGSASCGIAAGAREVEAAALETIKALGLNAVVSRTGCIGFCQREPLVDLLMPGGPRVCFDKMTPKKVRALLEHFASTHELDTASALYRFQSEEYLSLGKSRRYAEPKNGLSKVPEWSQLGFFKPQQRVILRNCGSIDPMSVEQAVARGAYYGAYRALTGSTPDKVIENILASGIRGRGGAGFPTGKKWESARRAQSDIKYIICNADEGDPGAFMDRSVLESDPHAVLEGMLIGAYAIGAREGFVYVRSEYPLAVTTIAHAITQAEERGLLGDNIFGSGFSLKIHLRKGSGAFVCGEETSLIASIEGHSGEPRTRPPYPAQEGLWGKPTVINNVKTWASIGPITSRGAAWYSSIGADRKYVTEHTPDKPSASTAQRRNRGTTVFSLVGAVKNTGLVEVPLGISLREMVFDVGGGAVSKQPIKAVQTGGPSGGCIPVEMLDMPVDYEQLAAAGSMMGSGGMIVLDAGTCMVDLARFFLVFTSEESCGKCAPCREGTKQMLKLLTDISEGKGEAGDLELLEQLGKTVKASSLCGLGGSAPNPVLTALRYFRKEFEAHIYQKSCPAGVCRSLITLRVDEKACVGCARCTEVCAAHAITGERKAPHRIDANLCTRCGACRQICPSDAVTAV
jgi:NADH:ubiquinone oxidoreductase subunit F (NADH-binding)/Pyruvate/2-oxoacid:ferredoxin oxidoreductase delta subunit/(2Fe-2S) ferredoxin